MDEFVMLEEFFFFFKSLWELLRRPLKSTDSLLIKQIECVDVFNNRIPQRFYFNIKGFTHLILFIVIWYGCSLLTSCNLSDSITVTRTFLFIINASFLVKQWQNNAFIRYILILQIWIICLCIIVIYHSWKK